MAIDSLRSYQDLKVWQRAMELAGVCHELSHRIPTHKSASLGNQMERAAVSVPANIAEGAGRRSRADFLRHLSIANGSLRELETHLMLAERLRLVPDDEIASALAIASETGRLLAGLVRSLRASSRRDPSGRA